PVRARAPDPPPGGGPPRPRPQAPPPHGPRPRPLGAPPPPPPRRGPTHPPHPLLPPAAPARRGAHVDRLEPARGGLAAPDPAPRRRRPRAGGRDPDEHADDPRVHPGPGARAAHPFGGRRGRDAGQKADPRPLGGHARRRGQDD